MNADEIVTMARTVRADIVRMSFASGLPHLGGSLSCADILVAAYFGVLQIDPACPQDPLRDRLILSKGHAASALYATLARRGLFPITELATFGHPGSKLAGHPSRGCVPGVEASTGSLGHGLSVGVGMALAGRLRREGYRVYVVMSDGECNEGSVWEAALLAGGQRLDRLTAIVDFNKWQATDRSQQVMALDPLADKWAAFGWSVHEADGHDLGGLATRLRGVPDGTGKPVAVIAHTVKGKGVSFMEDDNNWHYRIPDPDELKSALAELGATA
jgi:transketolase